MRAVEAAGISNAVRSQPGSSNMEPGLRYEGQYSTIAAPSTTPIKPSSTLPPA
jgi:hypothetical protein